MTLTRRRILASSACAAVALPLGLRAQTRPTIRVVIGFPPGGATDAIARVVTDRLPPLLGQPVIVENRPAAGGRMAADILLSSPADGATFMVAPNATPTFLMLVPGQNIKWNILKDFTGVATLATYPLGMGVALNTGATTPKEYVKWVRDNPGKANIGTPGPAGQNSFLGVQFAKVAGVDIPITPYKGSPPMVNDLVGGHVSSAISLMDGLMSHHRGGRLRVIGIFTKERSPLMPDIPTFAEQGIDVTSGEGWTGMWAKAGTPPAEIQRVQAAVKQVLAMPEVKEQMVSKLWVYPTYRDGQQTDEVERAELAHWEPIIKASGYKVE